MVITPQDFIKTRTENGSSISAAVLELASVLCIKERRAWLLYTGAAEATQAQLLLLSIWHTVPEARKCWQQVLS